MTGIGDNSLLRTVPLLLALLAGVVTTQLVPPYRDIAFLLKHEGSGSAAASPGRRSSPNIGGVDVNRVNIEQFGRLI